MVLACPVPGKHTVAETDLKRSFTLGRPGVGHHASAQRSPAPWDVRSGSRLVAPRVVIALAKPCGGQVGLDRASALNDGMSGAGFQKGHCGSTAKGLTKQHQGKSRALEAKEVQNLF